MSEVIIAVAAFVACALRGFQSRSAAKRRYVALYLVGGLMAIAEGTTVLILARASSTWLLLAASIGAGAGWVVGVYLNHKLFKYLKRRRKAA